MNQCKTYSISVVVPTFNRASLISETLDRILKQTRKPDEIIVVNDGSTDDTLSVLRHYREQLRVISIPNSGDLVARNTGLQIARGDLVAFCDDDDLWQNDFIRLMAMFWEKYTKPICAFSNFREIVNWKWADHSKLDKAPVEFWSGFEWIEAGYGQFRTSAIRNLIVFQPFFTSCLMVERERFLAIGGWDEGVSRMIGCDFATALRIAEHPPVGVLQQPLVGIRKHAGNFSGNVQRMNLGDADVLAYVLSTRPQLAIYTEIINKSMEARRLAAFDSAFANGDFSEAERISRLLSTPPSGIRYWLKCMIIQLPPPLRDRAWRILSGG